MYTQQNGTKNLTECFLSKFNCDLSQRIHKKCTQCRIRYHLYCQIKACNRSGITSQRAKSHRRCACDAWCHQCTIRSEMNLVALESLELTSMHWLLRAVFAALQNSTVTYCICMCTRAFRDKSGTFIRSNRKTSLAYNTYSKIRYMVQSKFVCTNISTYYPVQYMLYILYLNYYCLYKLSSCIHSCTYLMILLYTDLHCTRSAWSTGLIALLLQ